MKVFLAKYFTGEESDLLKKSMEARVDAQYYTDRPVSRKQYDGRINAAPAFLVKCKEVLLRVNEEEIDNIRNTITELAKISKKEFK